MYANFKFMVRLINVKNEKYVTKVLNGILKIQEKCTIIKNVNEPPKDPCLYAIWHKHHFCVYGLPRRKEGKVNVMISTSLDGRIISYCVRNLGLKTISGSAERKGAVSGSMQVLEALKNGESAAIMVDGPHGPQYKVKNGIIKLAKLSQVPIIPVTWYSPQWNFVELPSWDKMTSPLLYTRLVNVYGDPIYVPADIEPEDFQTYKDKIANALFELDKKAPKIFEEVKHEIPWKLNLDQNYQRFN